MALFLILNFNKERYMSVPVNDLSNKPYPECTFICEHWGAGMRGDCMTKCPSKFSTREELEKKSVEE